MAAEVAEPAWPAAVRVVRSERRRRTVSARIEGDTVVVQMPAGLPPAQEQRLADNMVERLRAQRLRTRLNGESDLQERAQALNQRYFAGRLRWTSLEYVTDQEQRLGSCTPATGRIRISHRLAGVPAWVQDYVLVHELAHLEYADHSRRFWAAVNRYRLAERARGYLMALHLHGDVGDEEL